MACVVLLKVLAEPILAGNGQDLLCLKDHGT